MAMAQSSAQILARKAAAAPLAPDDAAWADIPAYRVELSTQQMTLPVGGGAAKSLDVRALHDGTHLALQLRWATQERNDSVRINEFRDACAVMFPAVAVAGEPPPFFMGAAGQPVVIWQWKPDWEDPAAQEKARATRYPSYADYYVPANDAAFAAYGDRPREDGPANVVVAEGFGTATRTFDPDLEVKSKFADGEWLVVFRRPLARTHPTLGPGADTLVNFAAWEGSAQEVGARKSVSLGWHTLRLEGDAADGSFGIPTVGGVVATATVGAIAWAIRRRMTHAQRGKE